MRLRIASGLLAFGLATTPAAAQTSVTLPGGSTVTVPGDGTVRDEVADRLANLRNQFQSRRGGVLGLMAYTMIPDGSANSLSVSRGTAGGGGSDGTSVLSLSQFGFGFTVDDKFPLWLEGYAGYARYDPRAVFTSGEEYRKTPLRWNNATVTLGVGYDIHLTESWILRPIFNATAGYAASDLSLFGRFVDYRADVDLDRLVNRQVNAAGYGGALMLAYYDKRPTRDIDMELRYTQLWLQTWGNTVQGARGTSVPKTIGLWVRYRWPMGVETFGRPMRWVIDGNFSGYIGDQAKAVGFGWAVKIGGGIEFDVGRYEVGAVGINLSRVRLIARYLYGDNGITGYSVGLGFSF
jgi:hypothetical protein